jgi:hypothetical protein
MMLTAVSYFVIFIIPSFIYEKLNRAIPEGQDTDRNIILNSALQHSRFVRIRRAMYLILPFREKKKFKKAVICCTRPQHLCFGNLELQCYGN